MLKERPALAASATNGNAYVYLRSVCGRTIFSPPSQMPLDHDPTADNQATNGEIWYYAELPALMRNLNINKIYTFYKPEGSRKFVVNLAWDASNVSTEDMLPCSPLTCHLARTILPNLPSRPEPRPAPIDFPGRGPLKREIAPGHAKRSSVVNPSYPGLSSGPSSFTTSIKVSGNSTAYALPGTGLSFFFSLSKFWPILGSHFETQSNTMRRLRRLSVQ